MTACICVVQQQSCTNPACTTSLPIVSLTFPPHPVPPATHLQAFRRECEQLPPLAAAHYLRAALARPDIKPLLPRLRCRLLLVYGGEALHQADCVELATLVNKGRFAVMEVPLVGDF